jgi:hypothetical protein
LAGVVTSIELLQRVTLYTRGSDNFLARTGRQLFRFPGHTRHWRIVTLNDSTALRGPLALAANRQNDAKKNNNR